MKNVSLEVEGNDNVYSLHGRTVKLFWFQEEKGT